MAAKSQRPKGPLSSLNVAINALDSAKETSLVPAKAAFESTNDLLTTIRDSTIDKADYVRLGLASAEVCEVLGRGVNRRQVDQLSRSVLEAIEKLTMDVNEIQRTIVKRGKQNAISRRFHAKDDKKAIAAWRLDLDRILHVFNTELGINIRGAISDVHQDTANEHTIVHNAHLGVSNAHSIVSEVKSDVTNTQIVVSDIYYGKLKNRKDAGGQNQVAHASAPGESPPPVLRNTQGIASGRDVVSEVQTMVSDIRRMLKNREEIDGQHQPVSITHTPSVTEYTFTVTQTQKSVPGESPPPPPRIFFGRSELIEKVVGFVENLTPIALIGAGGIGKTSVALTVLHDDRIIHRFGVNRWFIRCDQFPPSHTNFLRRLSKVIGAGIENPEDLAPLRRYLSSKEMLIVLDNAESILGLQGASAQDIYAVVDELSQFSNICLCITSRISTIPPGCEAFEIPTLSMEAARDTFHRIYKRGGSSDLVNNILEQLDFHPLSVTLLATVAQHNKWDTNRLTKEWDRRRTGVLQAQHSGSLAAAIELSLASPMFRDLGPDARELLGVVAFFPQGVDEENVDWLFPTISEGPDMFDRFCILSLTYRSNGFITMLAPLRDYLRPKDPASSVLLGMTKERYFTRLSAHIHPDDPGFEESRWIKSEDVNVEHLLDVFTSTDANSNIWDVCATFLGHIYWHKPRLVVLGPKIEALPDDHPYKARCLQDLSWLFQSVGNHAERKRLLIHALKLWREQGDDSRVARTLSSLSDTNRLMKLYEEGLQQAREASEIFERLGDTSKQAKCLTDLAWLLHDNKQLDAAEEAASRAIDLLPEEGQESRLCIGHRVPVRINRVLGRLYRVLGRIHHSKGETGKAVHHLEVALAIASSLNVAYDLFWVHFSLARLFFEEGRFDDARTHIEHAKSHAVSSAWNMAHASQLGAELWDKQRRSEEAKSEALRALDLYEKLGATKKVEETMGLLGHIDRHAQGKRTPDESDNRGADGTTESK